MTTPDALWAVAFSRLSHELRSPLTVLTGALEEARRADPAESPSERLAVAALSGRAVARLTVLAERLSLAAQLANGAAPVLQPVDLAALTRLAVDALAAQPPRRGVSIDLRAPAHAVVVMAEPALLRGLVSELLTNAHRHAKRGLVVTVSAGSGVTVEDDGGGVAVDELVHLFDPFAGRGARAGLGMGLWLARGLAELQGGTLSAERSATGLRLRLQLAAAP